jgi:hypothetical protein
VGWKAAFVLPYQTGDNLFLALGNVDVEMCPGFFLPDRDYELGPLAEQRYDL